MNLEVAQKCAIFMPENFTRESFSGKNAFFGSELFCFFKSWKNLDKKTISVLFFTFLPGI
jgi:hypothetical protein